MQKASGTTAWLWCWTKDGCCSTINKVRCKNLKQTVYTLYTNIKCRYFWHKLVNPGSPQSSWINIVFQWWSFICMKTFWRILFLILLNARLFLFTWTFSFSVPTFFLFFLYIYIYIFVRNDPESHCSFLAQFFLSLPLSSHFIFSLGIG